MNFVSREQHQVLQSSRHGDKQATNQSMCLSDDCTNNGVFCERHIPEGDVIHSTATSLPWLQNMLPPFD